MSRTQTAPVPTETVEQQWLFQWARAEAGRHPELALMYHIPNEGKRSRTGGQRAVAEGLKSGVPDICLPVARGGAHGLYIEMKRQQGSYATKNSGSGSRHCGSRDIGRRCAGDLTRPAS